MAANIDPIIIAPVGDLILEVCQDDHGAQFTYRVDSNVLRETSRYFTSLLSDRFSEGQKLSAALNALKIAGAKIDDVHADALPRVPIVNVGRISKVSSIQNLTADFLRALHDQDLPAQTKTVPKLANIAVLADRFDAVPHIARYARRKKLLQILDAPTKSKSGTSLTEERARQRLLIGLLFDHPVWVTKYSKHLILRDSQQWKAGAELDDNAALWWDMPNGIEDEMIQRREYILETVNSLQAHFLKLYTSGERQCKLGYDSSGQCDSFQLGEMIRFFNRIGTLRLQGTIYDPSEPAHYSGDIDRLLDSLRQCSSYQIDRNHAHCGLRVRLIPLLDTIQSQLSHDAGSLDIGICTDCWNHHRAAYAWSAAKRPLVWTVSKTLTAVRSLGSTVPRKGHQRTPSSCLTRHAAVRDMYTAVERDWTARDVY